jgi:iron-sulfur cluster insertion protein
MTNLSSNLQQLDFTQSAASKVYQLISEEGNFDLNLRVFITGGGCSGFQYGFTFDEAKNDDDFIVEKIIQDANGIQATVTLLIDSMSYQYLRGAMVDYKEDLQGARFVISNPNAKTTCGCGSSFSVDDAS